MDLYLISTDKYQFASHFPGSTFGTALLNAACIRIQCSALRQQHSSRKLRCRDQHGMTHHPLNINQHFYSKQI